jgi:hypothetical protein
MWQACPAAPAIARSVTVPRVLVFEVEERGEGNLAVDKGVFRLAARPGRFRSLDVAGQVSLEVMMSGELTDAYTSVESHSH